MTPSSSRTAPKQTLLQRLALLAREEDYRAGMSLRGFAREIGVSHSVLSRIESGEVTQPRRDVLARLAMGAGRELVPLLYAAGYLSPEEFVDEMIFLLREGSHLRAYLEAGADGVSVSFEEIERWLLDGAEDEQLDYLAEIIFSVPQEGPGTSERPQMMRHLLEAGATAEKVAIGLELVDICGYVDDSACTRILNFARNERVNRDLEVGAERRRRIAAEGAAEAGS